MIYNPNNYNNYYQIGGVKCSYCLSEGTNASTCPCNPTRKNKPNYDAHYNWKSTCPDMESSEIPKKQIRVEIIPKQIKPEPTQPKKPEPTQPKKAEPVINIDELGLVIPEKFKKKKPLLLKKKQAKGDQPVLNLKENELHSDLYNAELSNPIRELKSSRKICGMEKKFKKWEKIKEGHSDVYRYCILPQKPPCPDDFVVIKELNMNKASLTEAYNNILIMELIRQGKLMPELFMKTYDAFICKEKIYLITQGIIGKSLREILIKNTFTEQQLMEWLYQISIAIEQMESNNMSHRDLHSSNVIIGKDGIAKIIDFGASYKEGSTPTIIDFNINGLGAKFGFLPGIDMWTLIASIIGTLIHHNYADVIPKILIGAKSFDQAWDIFINDAVLPNHRRIFTIANQLDPKFFRNLFIFNNFKTNLNKILQLQPDSKEAAEIAKKLGDYSGTNTKNLFI